MRSKDILKQALINYDGTLIVVSHDSDFLDGMVNIVYEFRNHKMKQHLGGIGDFLYHKKLENMRQFEMGQNSEKAASPKNPKPDEQKKAQIAAPSSKLSYEEQKEQERRQRKAKKAVDDCEALIVEIESAIAEMDNQLANHPECATTEFFEKYEAAKKQLADELNNWEKLTAELELVS